MARKPSREARGRDDAGRRARNVGLAPWPTFWRRFGFFALLALASMVAWIALGTVVFWLSVDGVEAVDAFRHASMIASGMGPVLELKGAGSGVKIFDAIYALLSGFVLLASAGMFSAPVIHRIFHHFHLNDSVD